MLTCSSPTIKARFSEEFICYLEPETNFRKKNLFASLLLSQILCKPALVLSGRQGELESLLEAKVGVFLGSYQEMCRDGFPGGASATPLQVELQHFYSITPSSFSSRNYHIPAHLGGQLWGEVDFTQAEKISGSVRVPRTPRSKTSPCHLRINFHL